ncbi:hypothetical protein [Halorubrum sp. DTA98]|uniref:hypothetical protein n=1 Tax=Halorubrum sp. DTA98 TaxID=3402163 RepID=UPI003AAC93AD
MSSWEDRHVLKLVDELDRLDRIPPDVAAAARSAADAGRYRDALDIALETDAVAGGRSVRDRDDSSLGTEFGND